MATMNLFAAHISRMQAEHPVSTAILGQYKPLFYVINLEGATDQVYDASSLEACS